MANSDKGKWWVVVGVAIVSWITGLFPALWQAIKTLFKW
jgi:hypothetical protein